MNFDKKWLLAGVVGVALASGVFLLQSPPQEPAAPCVAVEISIDNANSVHGLKDGKLFAYLDLAGYAQDLACHEDVKIQDMVAGQVTKAVAEWWKEGRLEKAQDAEVHVITILDKDEYAQASFNAALNHGKLTFRKTAEGAVEPLPATLDFSAMKARLGAR